MNVASEFTACSEDEIRALLDGGTLTYRVPPRADGSIPVSVWRKLD